MHSRPAPINNGRRLVLIDHENFVARTDGPSRKQLLDEMIEAIDLRDNDHVIAGASHPMTALEIKRRLGQQASVKLRRGKDGAEIAILSSLDLRYATDRWAELVIASGDHAFVPVARAFRRRQRPTTVVARQLALSTELYRACRRHISLRPIRHAVGHAEEVAV